MNQNLKTIITFAALALTLVASLLAQANLPVPPLPPEGQANIFTAMYDTILHNPSSLFVLIVLCVFAWLMDTLPFINSKYVTHYSTLLGGAIYWMFCHPANVPKTFPYAWPVLACIGCVCGFVAGILHRQIIGRLLEWVRTKISVSDPKPNKESKPMKNIVPLLLCLGALAGLSTSAPAQLLTNAPTEIVPAPVTQVVNFLTTPSTNWFTATYAIYNTETDDVGVGVAAFYKVNDFLGAFLALDELGGQLYMPSGNFQLSLPLKLFNRLDVIPFVRSGIATPVGRGNSDPNVAGIFGAGWAIRLPDNAAWYLPDDIIVDFEKWTNVKGNQIRAGLAWKF